MNPAQITKTLTERADRFAGPGLDVDQVLARAGEIRRGRRMRATIMMAAVVLAVAVPIGITTLTADGSKPAHHVATEPPEPDHSALTIGQLKTGKKPAAGYAYDGTLYGTDGAALVKGGGIRSAARLDGGYLVARTSPGDQSGNLSATFVADDGSDPGISWPTTTGAFAVSPGGNVGALVEPDGTVVAVQDAGSIHVELGKVPAPADSEILALAVQGENCSGRSEEAGCTVYVRTNDADPKTWALSPHQAPRVVFPGFRSLVGFSPDGLVAGKVSVTDYGSCSAIRSGAGATLWRTCDYQFEQFSPTGRMLLATIPYYDGAGTSELTILDTQTHQVVLHLKATQDTTIDSMSWEGDDHVLVGLVHGTTSAVVRVGLVGDREYALAPVTGPEAYISAYRVASH